QPPPRAGRQRSVGPTGDQYPRRVPPLRPPGVPARSLAVADPLVSVSRSRRTLLNPPAEHVALLLGDARQVPERHVASYHRLLVDLLRARDDLLGSIEH